MDGVGMSTKEWVEVVEAMEEVTPYYEKVNHLITLGLADTWRKEAASLVEGDDVVLEIGSGPGTFARHLDAKEVYCVEPSGRMASYSRGVLDPKKVTLIRGVGERLPLSEGSVDKVFCVFSFRDFYDRQKGASEIHRVLRDGGRAHIVDVSKPPPGPLGKLLELHVKHLVPTRARVAVGPEVRAHWNRDPYRLFVDTYRAFGFTTVYEDMLRRVGFSSVSTDFLKLKGATLTRGTKPWRSTS